jgi:hypothetical protein
MSPKMEHMVELQHYYDLLHEAEQERLARQALKGRPRNQNALCKALSWLGSHLSGWGNQLQERYGKPDTPSNPNKSPINPLFGA